VRLPDNYLKAHSENFVKNPEIGVVAGRVFDRMKLGDSQKMVTDTGKPYEIDFLPPQAMDPGIAWYYIDLVHTTKPQQVISARGCNMSFRKERIYLRNTAFGSMNAFVAVPCARNRIFA